MLQARNIVMTVSLSGFLLVGCGPAPEHDLADEVQDSSTGSLDAPALKVQVHERSHWESGSCVEIEVFANAEAVSTWVLTFNLAAEVTATWGGKFERRGKRFVVHPLDWNQKLAQGEAAVVGFCSAPAELPGNPRAR